MNNSHYSSVVNKQKLHQGHLTLWYDTYRLLVETPSRDVEHYRMLNVSADDIIMTTGSHYKVTPGDRKAVR